jgi:serine protease Do
LLKAEMNRVLTFAQKAGLAAVLAAGSPLLSFEPPDPAPETRALVLAGTTGSYLGIGVVEITPERARELGLKEEYGVEITRVADDSPAAKAGLKAGDVVLEYNGQRVEGVDQFMRLVRETPPGRDVKLSLSRGGTSQQMTVRTMSRKAWLSSRFGEQAVELPRIEMPDIRIPDVPRAFMSWRSSFLGIEGESLDSQLAEFFGVREGVLVRSVVKGSAAEKAGLRAGDVIVRVDDTKVATPREISTAVRAARSRKNVTVTAVREKRETSFNLPVEDTGSELHQAMPKPSRR